MINAKYPFAILLPTADVDTTAGAFFQNFFDKRIYDKNALWCGSKDEFDPSKFFESISHAHCNKDHLNFNLILNLDRAKSIDETKETMARIYNYFTETRHLNCHFKIFAIFDEPDSADARKALHTQLLALEQLLDTPACVFLICKTPYSDGIATKPKPPLDFPDIWLLVCYSVLAFDVHGIWKPYREAFTTLGLCKVDVVEKMFRHSASRALLEQSNQPHRAAINFKHRDIIEDVNRLYSDATDPILARDTLFGLMVNKAGYNRRFMDIAEVEESFFGDRLDLYYSFNVSDKINSTLNTIKPKYNAGLTQHLDRVYKEYGFDSLANSLPDQKQKIDDAASDYGIRAEDVLRRHRDIRPPDLYEPSNFTEIEDLMPYNCAERVIESKAQHDRYKTIEGILKELSETCSKCSALADKVSDTLERVRMWLFTPHEDTILSQRYYDYFQSYKAKHMPALKRDFYDIWLSLKEDKAITAEEMLTYIETIICKPECVRNMIDTAITVDNSFSAESSINLKFYNPDTDYDKKFIGISPSHPFHDMPLMQDEEATNLYVLRYDTGIPIKYIMSAWEQSK